MDTRTALITAAEDVCRRRGYDGFSYADLAREVGIRKASIHHHFPTKADLGLAVLNAYSDAFFAALERLSHRHGTAAAQLKAYVARYRRALDGGDSVCLCVALSIGRDRLSDDALKALADFHERSVEWLTARFEDAQTDGSIHSVGDADSEARACLALMEGAQLMARAAGKPAIFDNSVNQLARRLSV